MFLLFRRAWTTRVYEGPPVVLQGGLGSIPGLIKVHYY